MIHIDTRTNMEDNSVVFKIVVSNRFGDEVKLDLFEAEELRGSLEKAVKVLKMSENVTEKLLGGKIVHE